MSFNYDIDYAQKAIDLVKSGAPDYLVTQALADREKKIKDLGLADKVPSKSVIKDYIAIISAGLPKNNPIKSSEEDISPQKLDFENSTQGPVDFNGDSFSFAPNDYIPEGKTDINKIVGYSVLGLLGVVLVDKLLG